MENNWIKEFDERFPKNYQVPIDAIGLSVMMPSIKSFISQELKEATSERDSHYELDIIPRIRQQAREEGRQEHIYTNVKKAVQEERSRILGLIEEVKDRQHSDELHCGCLGYLEEKLK